jgi:hypothetical protein
MNESLPSTLSQRGAEALQARVAQRLAAALTEYQAKSADANIDARLAFARDRAMEAARRTRSAAAVAPSLAGATGGTAILGGLPGSDSTPWWLRLGSLVPLAVLLAGLVLIDSQYTRSQIEAAAEVDAAILADDLPPEAYRDQGFVEFLRSARP